MSKFIEFENNLKRYYVFDVKYKDKSWLMKLLGKVLFFNKTFMTDYITTIGNTIYYPSEEYIKNNDGISANILAHEIVHVKQKEKYGAPLFFFLYLFPQSLFLLSFLAILAVFWLPFLWCLLFLVFLAPIPAPWRKKFELEGYAMTLYMIDLRMKNAGYPEDQILKELSFISVLTNNNKFEGSDYWFMWPFGVDKELGKIIDDIVSGVISDTDEVYGRVRRSYLNTESAYEL